MKINKFVAILIAIVALPSSQAATRGYIAETAPDALSRDILRHPLRSFEEGAAGPADIPAAIGRNLPKLIEQNIASMRASTATAWLDQMGDLELEHIAQLYVNSNAAESRSGPLLEVAALRLDGAHLGRLSKYFGYAEVRQAILEAAPHKLDAFTANSSAAYLAPVAGAPLRAPAGPASFSAAGIGGAVAMAGFVPSTSMTFEQLYAGFRTMTVGAMGPTAAIYETAAYSGKNLVVAWGIGYAFGTGITYLMQEYTPDFYYDTFVPAVGYPIDYVQNLVVNTWTFSTDSPTLGTYQSQTLPVMGTTSSEQSSMGSMGGDWGMEAEYQVLTGGGGGGTCPRGQKCPPEWPY